MERKKVRYYSTNNKSNKVSFETALLMGQPKDYGLFMISREDIPKISQDEIEYMRGLGYSEIAFRVLSPFLGSEIGKDELRDLLSDAYDEEKIYTIVENVVGRTYIMWLTHGPTYSFKDYAARFFGRVLNYFLGKRGLKRTVVVATSGDTGGAVADALYGLENVNNVIFFPKNSISPGQRRQMTTLGGNIFAFEVNGDFDICQALAKNLLGDKDFAVEVFGDPDRITSANSISLGRLLPQAVYPFFAYSRILRDKGEEMIVSIPSGNFGDLMGTVIAKEMGLPIKKIIVGVNENREFPDFLSSEEYLVGESVKSPSSAMIVSHPSNLARLVDFYGGHMFDERDPNTKKVIRLGVIDKMPNFNEMRQDIFSVSISNPQHYETMREVFEKYNVILDPHGAVGWKALELYTKGKFDEVSVVYETADPGKFPDDVERAIGIFPELPKGMKRQLTLPERKFSIESKPLKTGGGLRLSDAQVEEAKRKIKDLLGN